MSKYNIDFVHKEVLIQFHFSKHLDKQMLMADAVQQMALLPGVAIVMIYQTLNLVKSYAGTILGVRAMQFQLNKNQNVSWLQPHHALGHVIV